MARKLPQNNYRDVPVEDHIPTPLIIPENPARVGNGKLADAEELQAMFIRVVPTGLMGQSRLKQEGRNLARAFYHKCPAVFVEAFFDEYKKLRAL